VVRRRQGHHYQIKVTWALIITSDATGFDVGMHARSVGAEPEGVRGADRPHRHGGRRHAPTVASIATTAEA